MWNSSRRPLPIRPRIFHGCSGASRRKVGPVAEKMYAPLEVMREIPALLRHSDWKVTGTIALVPGGYRLIDLQENDTSQRLYGAAVDLGSTTVVAYLWDLITGKVAAVASNYNRQISCGEDILARVNYAQKNGIEKLRTLAVESINAALTSASNTAGIDREDIYEVVVAGNTVMTHMLLGIDPAYIIKEPYVPVVAAGTIGCRCKDWDHLQQKLRALCIPCRQRLYRRRYHRRHPCLRHERERGDLTSHRYRDKF